ncbi:probable calcium-binding protein CML23 [Magnolia sinica]|uniref:probable calcium-binding protein CML23 n=1 Tax=Magnolia sinica TaxID=86752 RepID=UPI002657D861|nr:probable calcium-binding protein CML23 [Magnolia sinica]
MKKSSSKNSISSQDSSTLPSSLAPLALQIHRSGDLRLVFDKYDSNGDGKISSAELESMLRSFGSSDPVEEAESMVRAADLDGDGYISLEEFLSVNVAEKDSSKCLEDLRNAFDLFDHDKNGLISAEELHHVMLAIGEKASLNDCQQMIKGIDQNGDGAVNFDEFLRMMTQSAT